MLIWELDHAANKHLEVANNIIDWMQREAYQRFIYARCLQELVEALPIAFLLAVQYFCLREAGVCCTYSLANVKNEIKLRLYVHCGYLRQSLMVYPLYSAVCKVVGNYAFQLFKLVYCHSNANLSRAVHLI